jgi:hypothetical protein
MIYHLASLAAVNFVKTSKADHEHGRSIAEQPEA